MRYNILLSAIVVSFILAGCTENNTAAEDGYSIMMPEVTQEMTHPDYWLKFSSHPDKVLMSKEDISEYYGIPETDYRMILETGRIDTAYLRKIITDYSRINYSYYGSSGEKIDSLHWARILDNLSTCEVTDSIKYAVVVSNCEQRRVPTSERIYQNSDNIFFDDLVQTARLVNEPVFVLHKSRDEQWYFIQGDNAPAGWVHRDNIALCNDRKSWMDFQTGDFLLITANRTRLQMNDPDRKDYTELTMGTKLKLLHPDSVEADRHLRYGKNVYAVAFPVKNPDETLGRDTIFIPSSSGVNVGYLPYTRRNILSLAFSCLGDRYGWGGTYGSRDCSSFIQDIYRCFGIRLPRNSRQQADYTGKDLRLEEMTTEQKMKVLRKKAMPGSLLYLKGHVFMYLGEEKGRMYVINSSSSLLFDGVKRYVQSVMINTLDECRPDGRTGMEASELYKTFEN